MAAIAHKLFTMITIVWFFFFFSHRLDPRPDPRYEAKYRARENEERTSYKRLERVNENPNDLRHNLLRKHQDTMGDAR